MTKKLTSYITSTKLFYGCLFYLAFGLLLMIMRSSSNHFFEIIIDTCVNKYFLCFFVFPINFKDE